MSRLKSLVLHPLLIAAYPVVALLAWNIEEVQASTAIRALSLSLLMALILIVLTRWILKDRYKAGLITSISLILFYCYGHLYGAVELIPSVGILLGRHRLLTPLFLIGWVLLVWWVIRQRRDLLPLTRTLNIIAAVALIFPLASLFGYQIKVKDSPPPAVSQASRASTTSPIWSAWRSLTVWRARPRTPPRPGRPWGSTARRNWRIWSASCSATSPRG